jgi:bacterioferritin-associated ferredoxin
MIVCLCYGLSREDIQTSIEEEKCRKVQDIQRACGAGTDCGSCICALKQVLAQSNSKTSQEAALQQS